MFSDDDTYQNQIKNQTNKKEKKTDMSGHIKEEDFFFLRGGTHVCSCGMRAPIRGEDPKEESLL